MIGPVDVLAVMTSTIRTLSIGGVPDEAQQMHKVRAAVAELIEADKAYDAICDRAQRYPCPGMDEHVRAANKRRKAALARVQGGAE